MIARSTTALLFAMLLLPDEGQWLPTQIREWDWSKLEKRGMELTKDEFWHPEKGGVLSATVQINGCTASFVSKDGLMVTNHHCGFGAISALSSVEDNYLRDGFRAETRNEELPAAGVTAFVLERIENVTDTVHAAQKQANSDLERWQITEQITAQIAQTAEQSRPNISCSVESYLEGTEYHLVYRTKLTDVRLVYAPPRAVGEFGGDIDNWEWPRHTGDFAFFRAYTRPDGTPGDYAADNVPYNPEHFLRVSTAGVQDGDLAIIMGYPGSTQRYRTSRAVAMHETYVFPKRDELLTQAIEVLENAAATSEAKALEVGSRIKSLANVQKNALGMIFGLDRNAVVDRKLHEEAELQKWLQNADAQAGVVEELLTLDNEIADTIEQDMAIGFAAGYLLRDVPLVVTLLNACRAAGEPGRMSPRLQQLLRNPGATADLEIVQAPMLAIVLNEMLSMPDGKELRGTEGIGELRGMELVEDMFERSEMLDPAGRIALFEGGREAVQASNDPLVVLARGLAAEFADYRQRTDERSGRMLDVGRRWIAAQEAFRGTSFYPDANSTLRVSICQVKGYIPRDGMYYTPHTTVGGVLAKETGEAPFASPAALLTAAQEREKSRWFDISIGDVPVCFLTDGDTTGGNSGSPVINGKGELVGLNFDRVFEAVSGDFGWNAERSRNISCDIRYVLWVVDSVLPSPSLLKELGV
ncbi:MAG: S46 family peptidase [Planctomycetota bacterium]|nr:S46 family peptidase [Planctomycetota bacterium]